MRLYFLFCFVYNMYMVNNKQKLFIVLLAFLIGAGFLVPIRLTISNIQYLNIQNVTASTIGASNTVNLTKGLVGWWTFDGKDTGPTFAMDRSGNNNTGARNGMQSIIGKIGQAMKFDGSGDYLQVAHKSSLDITGDVTLAAWVKFSSSYRSFLVGKGSDYNSNSFFLGTGSGRQWLFGAGNGGTYDHVQEIGSEPDGVWRHVAGVRKGSLCTLYINGVYNNSYTLPFSPNSNAADLVIGRWFPTETDYQFKGVADDVRIYNRALSASEIRQLYKNGAGAVAAKTAGSETSWTTEGLVGWWTFDGKNMNSTQALDSSSNGNHVTKMNIFGVETLPSPTSGPKVVSGKIGQGIQFNGDSQFVSTTVDSPSLDLTTNMTLSAWVKKTERGRAEGIITKGSYALKIGPDDRPYFEMTTGSEQIVDLGLMTEDEDHSLFVFNGRLYGAVRYGHLYRYEGGSSWTDVGEPGGLMAETNIFSVYNGNLYAGVNNGEVYRYDGGTTWTSIGDPGTGNDIAGLTVFKSNLYTCTANGYIYRYDGDSSWTYIGRPGSAGWQNCNSLTVYNGYLLDAEGDWDGNVYRYNGGESWTSIGKGGALPWRNGIIVYDNKLYSARNNGEFRRYDGGTTWTNIDSTMPGAIHGAAIYGGRLYVGVYAGSSIFRYNGGESWTPLEVGGASSTYSMATWDGKLYQGDVDNNHVYVIGAGKAVYANTALDVNKYYHVSATYDGTTMKIYINGKLDSSTTTPTPLIAENNSLPLLIGNGFGSGNGNNSGGGDENFNGLIDDARVYNRALSAEEIKNLYQQRITSKVAVAPASKVSGTGLSKGLVGYWTFDGKDTGPTYTMDKSGNNNTGARAGTQAVIGKLGQGLKFDGVDDYIDLPGFDLRSYSSLTISAWVNFSPKDTGDSNQIVDSIMTQYPGGANGLVFDDYDGGVGANYNNGLRFWVEGSVCSYGDGAIILGTWNHVLATYRTSNGDTNLYVNGVNIKNCTLATNWSSGVLTNARIGNQSSGGGHQDAKGKIDDVRIYNRALSKTEVQQLYRMGK